MPADNQTKFQNTAEEHYSNKSFSVSTGVSFSMNEQAIDDSQQQVFIHRYDFWLKLNEQIQEKSVRNSYFNSYISAIP